MKEFLNIYADVLQTNHEQVGQVHIDFKRQCLDMTVDKLLEQFVQSKYTGFEKPGNRSRDTPVPAEVPTVSVRSFYEPRYN